ncbi:hypothetical protein [Aneurinibacillus tyrosinisolvens]|jgi:hypothetical protein|uniref:hypothetical protein n=1 Tax=Aneurinibacillus tyrosinisolvens TaxID=1443435 RepID=UPI00063F4037|nr:hypothetical protein [Aneurinibacillus tyrosinisolvens]
MHIENNTDCMECGRAIAVPVFAIYHGQDDEKNGTAKEEAAGYLCDVCSKKHKMKPVRNTEGFAKLEGLKRMLEKGE